MKSTAQRLCESYCRPITEEEWAMFVGKNNVPSNALQLSKQGYDTLFFHDLGASMFMKFEPAKRRMGIRREVGLNQMADLLHDRIAPWRLEEDGFVFYASTGQHVLHTNGLKRYHVTLPPMSNTVKVDVWNNDKAITADGATTYTQLLTLIELIG